MEDYEIAAREHLAAAMAEAERANRKPRKAHKPRKAKADEPGLEQLRQLSSFPQNNDKPVIDLVIVDSVTALVPEAEAEAEAEAELPMGPHGPGCECDPEDEDILPLSVIMAMLRSAALADAREHLAAALASGEPIGIPMQIGRGPLFVAVVPFCRKPWLN